MVKLQDTLRPIVGKLPELNDHVTGGSDMVTFALAVHVLEREGSLHLVATSKAYFGFRTLLDALAMAERISKDEALRYKRLWTKLYPPTKREKKVQPEHDSENVLPFETPSKESDIPRGKRQMAVERKMSLQASLVSLPESEPEQAESTKEDAVLPAPSKPMTPQDLLARLALDKVAERSGLRPSAITATKGAAVDDQRLMVVGLAWKFQREHALEAVADLLHVPLGEISEMATAASNKAKGKGAWGEMFRHILYEMEDHPDGLKL